MSIFCRLQALLNSTRSLDFLGPLALRLYLAPVFWMAGSSKLMDYKGIVEWFGNPDWGLGLPAPEFMAFLATSTELAGAVMLLIGLGTRWISVPLMFTMVVAAVTVHWPNGWLAIAEGDSSIFATDTTRAAIEQLDKAKEILQQHGNYDALTQYGDFVVLNNGIEFAATYFIMLLALFFIGSGKYFSVDYWIAQHFCK